MRKLTFALMLALLFGFAAAQNLDPTEGTGIDQVGKGTTQAEVKQTVTLRLPQATALHLDAANLVFDIGDIENTTDEMVCVTGNAGADPAGHTLGTRGTQVLPLGTEYHIVGSWTADEPPTIDIVGETYVINTYPPYILNSDTGELEPNSKKYFVCYKSFILQKFSNAGNWELSVLRGGDAEYDMYIQDNSICTFNANEGTGLFILPPGESVSLLFDTQTADTTGALAASCAPDQHKSWLDDLVVIAVKVNGETAGDHKAILTYTLTSTFPGNGN